MSFFVTTKNIEITQNSSIWHFDYFSGYSSADNTWEPESNLCNCQETLEAFEKQEEKKQSQSPSRSSQRLTRSPPSKRNSSRPLRKRPSEVETKASPKRLRNSTTNTNRSSSSDNNDEPVDKSTIDRIVDVRRNKQVNSIEYLIQLKKSKKNVWLDKDQLIDIYSQQIIRFLEDTYVK